MSAAMFQMRSGSVTASDTTPVAVSATTVTADSIIVLTVTTATGANAGEAHVVSKTPGVGFFIASGAEDTSVYKWIIMQPLQSS